MAFDKKDAAKATNSTVEEVKKAWDAGRENSAGGGFQGSSGKNPSSK